MNRRHALVTGASSGIGREFAVQLASLGYVVTGIARGEGQLQALIAELPGHGHQYCVADLGTESGVQAVLDVLSKQQFTLLVNNAGYSALQPFYRSDLALQQDMFNVNCGALTTLAHAFLRQAQSGDALINLASIVSYLPTPAQPMYSASKAFISALSECLWEEQRHRGVYVMGLCPGITQTGFIARASGGEADGRTLPAVFIQTAREVVDEALIALEQRKKAIVVTGRINRFLMQLPRVLTRHRLIRVLARIGNPERAL